MNAPSLDPQYPAGFSHADEPGWSVWRWVAYLVIAFGLHLGLIFALGDRKPLPPRPVKNAAALQTTFARSEWQQLDDPTIFALPHPRGFAGATWLRLPQIAVVPFRWTEAPRLLALPVAQLGAIFLQHAETNAPPIRQMEIAAPPLTGVLAPGDVEAPRPPAALRVNAGLAGRPFRNAPFPLPLQPATDNLTNSVVQILVDARGQVISTRLIPPGSGLPAADQEAVKIARSLRFDAVDASTPLTVGRLIFEWQGQPATNGAIAIP
jgi:hypothetical protein